jgi:hypothetical protein
MQMEMRTWEPGYGIAEVEMARYQIGLRRHSPKGRSKSRSSQHAFGSVTQQHWS